MEQSAKIRSLSEGFNQRGVRNHNERLILSVLQRHGELPGSEIARETHLSAQTVSVILRKLEADGLLIKGAPVKGKVGKPSIPMALNPEGALGLGVKVGRRSSEVVLTDLLGRVLFQRQLGYAIALPRTVFAFIEAAYRDALDSVGATLAARVCGIGVAAPFEIWKWGATDRNTPEEFLSWKDVSFRERLTEITDLPVFMLNDATSACWAEHVYGRGREYSDYAYMFVSTFIGGGIVLNQAVYEGPSGNAGAFGPLRVGDRAGRTRQLLDVASVHVLEDRLSAAGHDPRALWAEPQDWQSFEAEVAPWLDETGAAIAQACVSVASVIDFEAVIIDGAFPEEIRTRLVAAVREKLPHEDSRGLILPEIEEGSIGREARGIGAASGPIFAQYFLNTNARAAAPA
ncbi:MarR family transcriptional regulator [Litoreibacter ponti]|uniref:MarR family transcriptional regulator n=1 Tax=Litoreibacter ponti TaxID=1510457 RepID=A0A2T6BJC8_9RHOB|nr:ROK family transcriptional regulator [Litoreibacter ponti]PTX56168.1 MarR family transcriptional regulator [Litoreibacter ponti]